MSFERKDINRDLPKNVPEYDSEQITLGKILGATLKSTVYQAQCNGEHIAIKKIFAEKNFDAERDNLSKLRHSNILLLHGVCTLKRFLVLELAECALSDVIYKHVGGKQINYTTANVISWLKQCADGAAFIHLNNFYHGDLKSHNLLLFDFGRKLKIADFGESSKNTINNIIWRGSRPWAPCEALNGTTYNEKADVFSLGTIGYELISRTFPNLQGNDTCDGIRPPLTSFNYPESIKRLINACWNHDAAKRPTMMEISKYLADLSTKYPGGDIPLYVKPVLDQTTKKLPKPIEINFIPSTKYPGGDITPLFANFGYILNNALVNNIIWFVIFCVIIFLIWLAFWYLRSARIKTKISDAQAYRYLASGDSQASISFAFKTLILVVVCLHNFCLMKEESTKVPQSSRPREQEIWIANRKLEDKEDIGTVKVNISCRMDQFPGNGRWLSKQL